MHFRLRGTKNENATDTERNPVVHLHDMVVAYFFMLVSGISSYFSIKELYIGSLYVGIRVIGGR